jgi:PiT family inorganic phosphate transporter
MATAVEAISRGKSRLDDIQKQSSSPAGIVFFFCALLAGLAFIGFHVAKDLNNATISGIWPYCLLALALSIALGFEFVNGFHDTANAVATVIYTHSLPPTVAVVWSGLCNLTGVLFSSGTVAFAVITLLPVELILKVSSGAGFAMIFALLIAAILWNLGTWWLGLPASSSHTMVGSIIGVGLANQLLNPHSVTSGVDWAQAFKVFKALLFSPLVGFACAAVLFLVFKPASRMIGALGLAVILGLAAYFLFHWGLLWSLVFAVGSSGALVIGLCLIPTPDSLFRAPEGTAPPPWHVRGLLMLTCSGVSFFHGSNDGQKGMGLIMLILIGTVPTAYALNHAVSPAEVQSFIAASAQAGSILDHHVSPTIADIPDSRPDPRADLLDYIRSGKLQPETLPALRQIVNQLDQEVAPYKALNSVPAGEQANVRNDMYVVSETLSLIEKSGHPAFTPAENKSLDGYRAKLDKSTKYIPNWVKVAVALALGLGTMVGWRRIVITVGERIGKEHLTYAQGASAELVAMVTIFVANSWGLPVSTTHILSSGVAGTMAASGSGVRLTTVRNIAAGWVFTLPAAALLSGLLYCLFRAIS